MKKLYVLAFAAITFTGAAHGQTVTAPAPAIEAPAKPAQWHHERMRTCGAEWRVAKAKDATLKGREAWNTFRAECFKRHPKPASAPKA